MSQTPQFCVLHPHQPVAIVCVLHTPRNTGAVRDFCADCIEAGRDDWNFGRCYLCQDGDHEACIGVPCQCECPGPNLSTLEREIEAAERWLAELRAKRALVDVSAPPPPQESNGVRE